VLIFHPKFVIYSDVRGGGRRGRGGGGPGRGEGGARPGEAAGGRAAPPAIVHGGGLRRFPVSAPKILEPQLEKKKNLGKTIQILTLTKKAKTAEESCY